MYKHLLDTFKYLHNKFISRSYVARAVQQIIIILAIIIAVEESSQPPLNILILILTTVIVLQISINYSNAIAEKIDQKVHLRKQLVKTIYEEVSNITKAIVVPMFLLLLAAINLISTATAILIIKIFLLIILFIYGYLGGKLSGDSVFKSLALGFFTLFIGGILVIVRSLL